MRFVPCIFDIKSFVVLSLTFIWTGSPAQTSQAKSREVQASVPKSKTKKAAPPASIAHDLPEAHNGQFYDTQLVDVGPLSLPVTCDLKDNPTWLNLDCNQQWLTGTPKETIDKTYVMHLVVTGHDKKQITYVLTLPVRTSADVVSLTQGSSKATASKAAAATSSPAPPPAPTAAMPTYFVLAPKISPQTQVTEGTATISGSLSGIPAGAPTINLEVLRIPDGQQSFVAPLKPTTGSIPVAQVPVTNGIFTLNLVAPLTAGEQVKLVLVPPDGVTFRAGSDSEKVLAVIPSLIPRPSVHLTSVPTAGVNTITGFVAPMPVPEVPADLTTTPPNYGNIPQMVVWLRDPDGREQDTYRAVLQVSSSSTGLQAPVGADGTFSLLLKSNLVAGQTVRVEAVPPFGRSFTPGTPDKTSETSPLKVKTSLAVAQPFINTDLREGVTVIGGTATATTTASGPVNVAIVRLNSEKELTVCQTTDQLRRQEGIDFLNLAPSTSTNATISGVDQNGAFKMTLTTALHEGDRLQVVQVFPPGTDLPEREREKCNSAVFVVLYAFDWYRTNVTFAAGVLLSNSSTGGQSSANFSQANQFYSLNVDRSWRLPGADCVCGKLFGKENTSPGVAIAPSCRDWKDGTWHAADRWKASRVPGFSTYFETRLTSIPVSSTTTTTTTGSSSSAPTTTPAFLTSQKTVRVATGAYFPWVVGHKDGHHPDGIFIAPIAKIGFDTIAGSAQQTNVILPNNSVGILNYETAYNFYSYGGRVGHINLSSSKNRAPLIDDYLDITIGPFSNLQSFICHTTPHTGSSTTPNTGPFTATTCLVNYPQLYNTPTGIFDVLDSRKRLYRVDLEGLIRVPIPATAIPFYIGFNANIAQHQVGVVHLDHAYAPPDDIRIFFGTKIDIGSFLSKFNLGTSGAVSNASQ